MIDISPPAEGTYLTIATAHNRENGNNKGVETVRYVYKIQHWRVREESYDQSLGQL